MLLSNHHILPPQLSACMMHWEDCIFTKDVSLQAGQTQLIQFENLQPLQKGIYSLKFSDGQSKQSFKLGSSSDHYSAFWS